eukprot:g1021.t1
MLLSWAASLTEKGNQLRNSVRSVDFEKHLSSIKDGVASASEAFYSLADLDTLEQQSEQSRAAGGVGGLDMYYLCDRVLCMGMPTESGVDATGRCVRNRFDAVRACLNRRHGDNWMVWNLSEVEYDASLFDGRVQTHRFPGHPSPPLGLLFTICTSMESWLASDPENVAVVHCMTGKGRTLSVCACFMAWVGEFPTVIQALQHAVARRGVPMERVILPSHRRYLEYFSSVMGGVKPRPKPMFLKRVIVNSVPVFGSPEEADEGEACGCRPYLQIFKCGKLLFDSRSALDGSPGRFYSKSDLSFSFSVNCALQGDILVRCRHDAGKEGGGSASTTMFRASFHTGYIANLIQRLPRQQCDGARNNDKFDVDFFVDLIFDHSVEDSSSTLHGYEYDDIMDTGSAFWNTIGKRQERLRR